MNQLTEMFDNQELRIVQQDEESFFLLKDVCEILSLGNPRQVKTRLEDEVISNYPIQDSLGRTQQATFVNEDGLYDVILDSRKPEAKRFRKWVTSEVLPSIRKTGEYSNVRVLDERQSVIQSMKLTIETSERQDEMQKVVNQHATDIGELKTKVDEQITLHHGEQRRLQKGVARRVYEFTNDKKEDSRLFREAYREIKDRFGVASYKDVKRKDLQSAIAYIENWIPRQVS
ncbi:BRO family protein [Halobacillus sp. SY10]|uniref:BRO family protein n=1 Tax=Halobacillus sp. SY10 TaxID=3381356 RepID=UPI0038792ADC